MNCGKVTLERYINPRLTSGIEHVMYITASAELFGQHNAGFVWYEPEFSLCKTKAFRKLYEARALELARRVRREKGYDLVSSPGRFVRAVIALPSEWNAE